MSTPDMPSPQLFFETVNAYQRTEALRAALELGVFSAIGDEAVGAAELARRVGAAERGARILCDYLVIMGMLDKDAAGYRLTRDTAVFLDRRSPHYLGGAIDFLLTPPLRDGFGRIAEAVRKGGTVLGQGSLAPEHPMWVDFARAMAPVTGIPAQLMAELVQRDAGAELSVLDVAASHGLFGLAFARRFPKARIFAQDWPNVLAVATENAAQAGVGDRYQLVPGDAFTVDLGQGHDVALVTNFLHHFDVETCVRFLRRVRQALAPGGTCLTLEFVVDEGRLSPLPAAGFPIVMLATTPAGDAYTFAELERMFAEAGFARSRLHALMPGMQQVVISDVTA